MTSEAEEKMKDIMILEQRSIATEDASLILHHRKKDMEWAVLQAAAAVQRVIELALESMQSVPGKTCLSLMVLCFSRLACKR
jgi:hypothetical protein